MYASSKCPIGLRDNAFKTSGCALEGPGPSRSLEEHKFWRDKINSPHLNLKLVLLLSKPFKVLLLHKFNYSRIRDLYLTKLIQFK